MTDWTWLAGPAVTVAGFIATGIGVIFAVRRDVTVISVRLEPLEDAIVKLTGIIETLARQDERLKVVERDHEARLFAKQRT